MPSSSRTTPHQRGGSIASDRVNALAPKDCQSGGSIASDRVNALAPKDCQSGGSRASDRVMALAPKDAAGRRAPAQLLPAPIRAIMAGSSTPALSAAYQIGAGRGVRRSARRRRASSPSSSSGMWFSSRFLPALATRLAAGDAPEDLVTYMRRTWNRRFRGEQALTRAMAMDMLRTFAEVNADANVTEASDAMVPVAWLTPSRSHRRRGARHASQRGGASNSCPPSLSTLPHTYDNFSQHRGNVGDSILTGASIPRTAFQNVTDWFHGKTTLLSTSDAVTHSGVQFRAGHGGSSAMRIPGNFNQTVQVNQMVDAANKPCTNGGPCTVTANVFPAPQPVQVADVSMPHQRAGATATPRRRRRRRHHRSSRALRR